MPAQQAAGPQEPASQCDVTPHARFVVGSVHEHHVGLAAELGVETLAERIAAKVPYASLGRAKQELWTEVPPKLLDNVIPRQVLGVRRFVI